MKQVLLYNIYVYIVYLFLLPDGCMKAQGIRIVPQRLSVKNDSLHVQLRMDLNEVRVGRSRAFIFTPQLLGEGKQQVSLPAVVSAARYAIVRTSGRRRFLSVKNVLFLIFVSVTAGMFLKISLIVFPYPMLRGCSMRCSC